MASSIAGDGHRGTRWSELGHDLLVAIFARLGVEDLIFAAQLVCVAWRGAALDPLLWRRLDLRDWDNISHRLGGRSALLPRAQLETLLHLAVERSIGSLEVLLFPDFADGENLHFVTSRCPNLQFFSLAAPSLYFHTFCKAISYSCSLKGMAVDESCINYDVLLHVRDSCPFFVELEVYSPYVNENMASVICNSLPNLKKLVINNSELSRVAIMTFLDCLKELEHFDISGYDCSAVTEEVLLKASRLPVFLWTSKHDLGEFIDCSDLAGNSEQGETCECEMDQKMMEWLTQ